METVVEAKTVRIRKCTQLILTTVVNRTMTLTPKQCNKSKSKQVGLHRFLKASHSKGNNFKRCYISCRMGVNICSSYTECKGLISNIHKKNLYNNTKTIQFFKKMGRETQIKTTVGYHLTLVRKAVIKTRGKMWISGTICNVEVSKTGWFSHCEQ